MTAGPHVRWDALETTSPLAGISASVVVGERLSAARYVLEPHADVPEHAHDNEEFGQVMRGSLELRCDGTTTTLREGEAFVVPAGVPHAARALADGCDLLECYAPPRVPGATQ